MVKSILALGLAALASMGCGGSGGNTAGFVNISDFDPSVESYNGDDSLNLSENGYILRINASAAPVHEGLVSVWFQDVEQQEIRFPGNSHPLKIPIAPNATYVFHAWFYGIDVGGGATGNDMPIELSAVYYRGTDFVDISATTTTYLSSFGTWLPLSFSFHVPSDVDHCYIAMKAKAAAAFNMDLYLDDFSLERTN